MKHPLHWNTLKAATKVKGELPTDLMMESIPLKELSSLAEEIHIKTQEVSQNTDLDMRSIRPSKAYRTSS